MLKSFLSNEKWLIIYCIMKNKVMKTIIANETVSQNTVSGEKEELVTVRVPEIAKKVLRVCNKDKEQTDDTGSVNKIESEIEQTSKDLNKAREVYFDLI